MKRIIIALLLAIVLMMTVGTSVVLANGTPNTIHIVPDRGNPAVVFNELPDNGSSPPPVIVIETPQGKVIIPRRQ